MDLQRFLRPLSRVANADAKLRFTLDGEELDVAAFEYIIRDSSWYIRLRKRPKAPVKRLKLEDDA